MKNIEKQYTLDLKVIQSILLKQSRHYLNIKKLKQDINNYYVLSYTKFSTSYDNGVIDYIIDILTRYIDVLNKKKDKSITLEKAHIDGYEKGKSFILDYINQNWEGYKAGEFLVKHIVKKNNENIFSLDISFLEKLIANDEYTFILFFLDKMNLTLDINSLKNFIGSLNTKEFLKDFTQLELKTINKVLKEKGVGKIKVNNDDFEYFQKSMIEHYEEGLDLETLQEYVFYIFIGFLIVPINISGSTKPMYNRIEIIKSNKTEDKINKTFSNDIFHYSLKKKKEKAK